jgi:pyruvate dehydrogenase E1 component
MVDLYREGVVTERDLQLALKKYDIDGAKPNPRLV